MLENFCQREPQISKDIGIRFFTARNKWSCCAKKKPDISEIPGAVGIQHSGFVKPSTEAYEIAKSVDMRRSM
jgi:hypothetical protein